MSKKTKAKPATKSPWLLGKEAQWDGKAEEENPFIPDDWKGRGFPNDDARLWHEGYWEARVQEDEERRPEVEEL